WVGTVRAARSRSSSGEQEGPGAACTRSVERQAGVDEASPGGRPGRRRRRRTRSRGGRRGGTQAVSSHDPTDRGEQYGDEQATHLGDLRVRVSALVSAAALSALSNSSELRERPGPGPAEALLGGRLRPFGGPGPRGLVEDQLAEAHRL